MFIFIFGVVLGAVPQYLKLILLASSEGISLVSLALMNVSNLTATLNIFILHFEQIKQCVKQNAPKYSFDACQASLLTFYYTYGVHPAVVSPLPAGRTLLFQSEIRGVRRRAQTQRQHARGGFVGSLGAVRHPGGARVEDGGVQRRVPRVRGVRFALGRGQRHPRSDAVSAPGLRELVLDGSGSLSYLRLLLSIGGGVGATVQKAVMHEDVSTWFPPLVGHSLEMVIVLMNLYHDMHGGGARFNGAKTARRNPEERTTIRGRRRAGMWRAGRRRR